MIELALVHACIHVDQRGYEDRLITFSLVITDDLQNYWHHQSCINNAPWPLCIWLHAQLFAESMMIELRYIPFVIGIFLS